MGHNAQTSRFRDRWSKGHLPDTHGEDTQTATLPLMMRRLMLFNVSLGKDANLRKGLT